MVDRGLWIGHSVLEMGLHPGNIYAQHRAIKRAERAKLCARKYNKIIKTGPRNCKGIRGGIAISCPWEKEGS